MPGTISDQTSEVGRQGFRDHVGYFNQGHSPRGGSTRPAREFRSLEWRAGNALAGVFAWAGIGPMHLLTTCGRRTGRPRTIPVVPVEQDGRTWLVAPYGAVSWVRNARAAGRVRLRRGRKTSVYAVREVRPDEAGPVLKRYVGIASRTRACSRASKDSPAEDFVAEADRYPVFELTPLSKHTPR